MAYVFKYHPDEWVGRNNQYVSTKEKFLIEHPEFTELLHAGNYFEYKSDGTMHTLRQGADGTWLGDDVSKENAAAYAGFKDLIAAINQLALS